MEMILGAVLFLGLLLLLYGTGIPVAIAMGITSLLIMLLPLGPDFILGTISNQLLFGLNSFTLLAIPFYVLLGRLMNSTGLTEDIFDFARSLVGQFRGGLAYVNVVASMIFSGMSGLAIADVAGLGRVEYRAMMDNGYDRDLAVGITGSSAVIGPIIPPSMTMILYGVLAGESVGELFIGGVIPGILLGLALMITIWVIVRRRGYEPLQEFDLNECFSSFIRALPALVIPIIIIFGILLGVFTATEAGAVAVIYALFAGFVFGDLTTSNTINELKDAMVETFSITFIIGMATLYGLIALELRIPMMLTDWVAVISTDPTVVTLLLVLILIIIGTFMDTTAAVTILVPVLVPVLNAVGIDPIHFGVVMTLTLMLGLVTPPFGIILFVLDKVTDASLETIIKAIVPFYLPILAVLLLIIFIPDIVLYLPRIGI